MHESKKMRLRSYLTHPLTLSLLAGILTVFLMRLDCIMSKEEKSTAVYCKNSILVSLIVGLSIYFVQYVGNSHVKSFGGAIVEEINLGEPNF